MRIVSLQDPDGTELSLEHDEHPAARPSKQALVEDDIPFTSFAVDDVAAEHERLVARGVRFTQPPAHMGTVTTAGSTTRAATSSRSQPNTPDSASGRSRLA